MDRTINRYILPWIPIVGLICVIADYRVELSSDRPFVFAGSIFTQVVGTITLAYWIMQTLCGC